VSDYIDVHFGGLSEGEAQFALAARALLDELSDLESALKGKLSTWDGDAQAAYWVFQKKWAAAATDVQNIVTALGAAIGNAHANYTSAERANTGIWAG
jgi:6 kDa early secretory antigenic target